MSELNFISHTGYSSSPYVLQPFDETEFASASPTNIPHMQEFNVLLSSVCIASEHAYGLLKGLFFVLERHGRAHGYTNNIQGN